MVVGFAIGAVIFLALLAGLLDHPPGAPMDSGTPATVTTLGGPR
ncbi:MAG: hypothetical protein ACJ72N_19870 [Labedaea sp.]